MKKSTKAYVPDADEPLAYRLFWQEVRERLTGEETQGDPEGAKETLRAIAEKHADGNADAETYFFLDAEWMVKEKSRRFISSDKYRLWLEAKKNLYGLDKWENADLVDIYLSDQYAERHGKDRTLYKAAGRLDPLDTRKRPFRMGCRLGGVRGQSVEVPERGAWGGGRSIPSHP